MSKEQRHHRRLTFSSACTVTHGADVRTAELVDISLNGALVKVADQPGWVVGTPVKFELRLDERGEATIAMTMEIVSARDATFGLRRKSISLDSIAHLRRVLELNFGSIELIDREISELVDAE